MRARSLSKSTSWTSTSSIRFLSSSRDISHPRDSVKTLFFNSLPPLRQPISPAMNNIMLRYTIFRTKWGYFGLAGMDAAVCRTFLPGLPRQEVEQKLLEGLHSSNDNCRWDKDFQQDIQERIMAYYEGEPVDFSTDPTISLNRSGLFAHKVLQACRKIAFGRTTTYSDLARQVGSPRAARAVGSVMASNPIPLIIPCHRVLRTDGSLGGFSAPGGTAIKKKMLHQEQSGPTHHASKWPS
jgi:methylated-DNA-[protein]-cysteine S-methyltransferase